MATRPSKHVVRTAANFLAKNEVIPAGVFGIETDTHRFKVGDGETTWLQLEYANGVFDFTMIGTMIDAAIEVHATEEEAHAPANVGADEAGAAAAGITPEEDVADIDWEAENASYAIDYATDKQVQKLGTLNDDITLTKGTGWPTTGTMAYVLLLLTLASTPTVTWTVVDKWTTDPPTDDGEYLVHLRYIGGTIYGSAETVANG